MGIRRYLPSAQFTLIFTSLAVSGGLVFAADYFSGGRDVPSSNLTLSTQQNSDWLETLREIQAQNSDYTLPTVPSTAKVNELLSAAQTNNVTDTVGRTLLVNLSSAKAEGLGGDIPTQEKLIATAMSQIETEREPPRYTQTDLNTTTNSKEAQHTYGNAMMETMVLYPNASYYEVLLAVGQAIDTNNSTKLAELKNIGGAYADLANALSSVTVPETLAPLHLQIVNNFAQMQNLISNMQTVLDDPLRCLAALELYEGLIQETSRVFTNIAQQFSGNGILFTKEEPGSAWSTLLP